MTDRGARERDLVGDEMACLSGLADELPVPPAFCMTALSPYDLLAGELDELWALLTTAYARMQTIAGQSEPRLVVRRSRCDLSPVAGMPPTFLNIVGLDGLAAAVHEVLAWPAPTRSTDPRLPPEALGGRGRSAVLVQLLVPAEAAVRVGPRPRDPLAATPTSTTGTGSAAPVRAAPVDHAVISVRATWGLGEGIADGATPADVHLFDHDLRLLHHEVADKEWMTVLADGGVDNVRVPTRLRRAGSLDLRDARRAATLYLRARQRLGRDVWLNVAAADGDLTAVACTEAD
ncbi:hypothetical protein AWW66_01240 [Micromonospora rosaria]|uniref:Pyruvate phosphate dikinase AMP/ATP-binding domain-containing protein n=1 Tax=Micromonospora rosaria TaxID=47874 RepID=A0A136PZF5_9ACTN|nr:PEP/pyruvate-binding domain-containing protein [Micromonospora rosaria]KXK63831.1 hypothetical protein AWW66_01240 [Micromonospora rosaria]